MGTPQIKATRKKCEAMQELQRVKSVSTAAPSNDAHAAAGQKRNTAEVLKTVHHSLPRGQTQ